MKAFAVVATFALLLVLTQCTSEPTNDIPVPVPTEIIKLSSTIPSDVNVNKFERLMAEGDIQEVRQMFDRFSWKSFAAINWPTNADGTPKEKITDVGTPAWYQWKEAFEVFRDSGLTPEPWGAKRTVPSWMPADQFSQIGKDIRILYKSNKIINIADEELQAFAGPMYDQSGNLIRYEVLMNKEEFDYIVDNKLFNINGQIEFSKSNTALADFPAGVYQETQKVGAVEIKIAWKVLVEGKDDFSRYIKVPSYVYIEKDKSWKEVQVGMVGFHINHKTTSATQWVWSTFEHVDNLNTNPMETFDHSGKKVPITPSFYDPECEICPTNQWKPALTSTYMPAKGKNPTFTQNYYIPDNKKIPGTPYSIAQAHRMIQIPERLQDLNKAIQEQFAALGSPLQYYNLIGTQFPKNQQAPPAAATYAAFPNSVLNKPGGDPDPVFLTNMTMETYFQNGNQGAYNFMENGSQPLDSKDIFVFGTESCMGCHSSAGITINYPKTKKEARNGGAFQGGQLTADFVWLLTTQPSWINNDTIIKPK